jgi:hypothetical protein
MALGTTVRGAIGRHRATVSVLAVVAALGLGFLLYWFAPWNLVVDRRVDEGLPVADAAEAGAPEGEGEAGGAADGPAASPGEGGGSDGDDTATLARGRFSSLEHATSGTAAVLELADGSRFLRLQDLDTSNGPDLRVILTDQPVSEDWHVWDDGRVVDLGALKGNVGSSNYAIGADVDLDAFETAVIWCRRFSVGFGVAPLGP